VISEDLLEFSDNLIDCGGTSDQHQNISETSNDGQSSNSSILTDNLRRKISIESKNSVKSTASKVQENMEVDLNRNPTPTNFSRSEEWSKMDSLTNTVKSQVSSSANTRQQTSLNYTLQADHAEGISCKPETAKCEEPLVHISSNDDLHTTTLSKAYLLSNEKAPNRTSDLSRQSDHVSCEDLLEFACDGPNTRRTRGPRNGEQSDEVRIMLKVLHEQSTPESCIAALNVTEWDVLAAIKLERLQGLLKKENSFVGLEDCKVMLNQCGGDVVKAAALLQSTEDTAAV